MLKLHKSKNKEDEWILYNPNNFNNQHTHVTHLRIALKIKYLVSHKILPTTKNLRFIESCIRVADKGDYKKQLKTLYCNLKNNSKT